MRVTRVQFQPLSTIQVRRQTLQSLWGSAFASGATTGQPIQELEWKTRPVEQQNNNTGATAGSLMQQIQLKSRNNLGGGKI